MDIRKIAFRDFLPFGTVYKFKFITKEQRIQQHLPSEHQLFPSILHYTDDKHHHRRSKRPCDSYWDQ